MLLPDRELLGEVLLGKPAPYSGLSSSAKVARWIGEPGLGAAPLAAPRVSPCAGRAR